MQTISYTITDPQVYTPAPPRSWSRCLTALPATSRRKRAQRAAGKSIMGRMSLKLRQRARNADAIIRRRRWE